MAAFEKKHLDKVLFYFGRQILQQFDGGETADEQQ